MFAVSGNTARIDSLEGIMYALITGGMPGLYCPSTEHDAFEAETLDDVAEAVVDEIRSHFEPEFEAPDLTDQAYSELSEDVDRLAILVAEEIDCLTPGGSASWVIGCTCPSDWVISVTTYATFDAMLQAVYGGDMEAIPEELLP